MPGSAKAGALIYAKNLERVSTFYQQLLGMKLLTADAQHHVIESLDMQLIIHAIPPHIAASFDITTPPLPREEQAIKLFFTIASLAMAADVAASLGGALFGQEYARRGFTVRNGFDPEGNIFHVRELKSEGM
jgi:predicted enzyme related to lactoylglutathione lyase